jgi:hypothetical protein
MTNTYYLVGSVNLNAAVFENRQVLIYKFTNILGDLKWLWVSMATTYENPCGNRVGGVELTFVWH